MTPRIFEFLLRTTGWAFLTGLVLLVSFISSLQNSPFYICATLFVALLGWTYAVLGGSLTFGADKMLQGRNVNTHIHFLMSGAVGSIALVVFLFCGLFDPDGMMALVAIGSLVAMHLLGIQYLGRSMAARYGESYVAERRKKLWQRLVTEVTACGFFEPAQKAKLLNYYRAATGDQLVEAIAVVLACQKKFPN